MYTKCYRKQLDKHIGGSGICKTGWQKRHDIIAHLREKGMSEGR